MDSKTLNKFLSRKFTVTMFVASLTGTLAYADKMDGQVALVLAACVGAYNWANTKGKDYEYKD